VTASDYFRALRDEQREQPRFGVVVVYAGGDGVERRRHAGAPVGVQQRALAEAERGHLIDHAHDVFRGRTCAQQHPSPRVDGGEVVEEDLFPRRVGGIAVYHLDLDEREVAFVVFGGANLAAEDVACTQVEAADL